MDITSNKRLLLIFGVIIALLSFLAGGLFQKTRLTGGSDPSERKILYYIDPMHPSYKSDKPGIAPDCGMKLEPVYADGAGVSAPTETSAAPGTVKISSDRQQLIGVKVATVEKRAVSQTIRMLGRVAVDETRVYRINATVDGWITKTSPMATGGLVKKDEVLAGFYSSEIQPVQTTYIYTLNSNDRVGKQDLSLPGREAQLLQFDNSLKQQRENLMNLGMGTPQIEEMNRTREYQQNIDIISPAEGIILLRNVSLGLRFEKGYELYRIADLSHVWILADVFENEAQFLTPGITAKVTLPNQNLTFTAKVSNAVPQFDLASRTLKLRLEVDNPNIVLKPDMFVDVEFPVKYEPGIAVPVDAVVDTGLRKIVFVDKGNGTFEPRRVQTGWRRGGLVEITRGLMDKERIVVAGTFMIDSESRMQAAAMGIYDEGVMDPVCGMYIDEKKARASGRTMKFGADTFYFCSPECMQDFMKNPRRYIGVSSERHAKAAETALPATSDPGSIYGGKSRATSMPMTSASGTGTQEHGAMTPPMAMPMSSAPGTHSRDVMAPAATMPMTSPTGTHHHHD
jgi:Cu(I)/Ag(I) efflux system membrane fusion protein